MIWLTNCYNPYLPDSREKGYFDKTDEEWQDFLKWISCKVISEPKSTTRYSTEELNRFGYVGVYEPKIPSSSNPQ